MTTTTKPVLMRVRPPEETALLELNCAHALNSLLYNFTEWQRDGLRMVNVEEVRRAHEALFGADGPFAFVSKELI